MQRRQIPITPVLLAISSTLACTHATRIEAGSAKPSTEAAPDQPATLADKADTQTSTKGTGDQVAAKAPPKERAKERLVLDLAQHLPRAEVQVAGEPALDMRGASGRKYDAGGWLSGVSGLHEVGKEHATIIVGHRGTLWLPSHDDGPHQLEMRLRSARATPLTVYVNGETVADLTLKGDDFEIARVELKAGALHAGDNELLLRAHRSGAMPGVGSASLAISWLRLTKPGNDKALDAAILPRVEGAQANAALHLNQDVSASFTLEVPTSARLRANLEQGEAGELRVIAHGDGRPTTTLATVAATGKPQVVDVDLSSLTGNLAQIELKADKANQTLTHPRIITLERDHPQAAKGDSPQLKHVLLILIDTLRADKLSPYNDKTRVETPGLRQFLRDAAVMLNARSQENWTKPSVATLLSSLFPWEHNAVTGEARVPNSVELFPELMKKRGYHTAAFIANGYVSDKFGFRQGLDFYRNYIREGRKTKAQFVAADVLEFLDKRPKDKPFFIYMHTIDPHVPYKPPQSFLDKYDNEPYSGPVNFRKTATLLEKVKMGSLKLNDRDKRHLEALYDAEINYHDVHFAAVLRGLEERGLDKETIVVVTADHGEEFWDHGSVGHGHSVYDELLHIPLVLRIPGVTHGAQALPASVGLVDVMPTILDALGQTIPDHLSGRSFLPDLQGHEPTAPTVAVSGFMDAWRTAACGSLKLIQRSMKHTWLYDVKRDPKETQDLAESRPIAIRHMRGLLGLALDGAVETTPNSAPKKKEKKTLKRENVTIDKATKEQLEALGYVGGKP